MRLAGAKTYAFAAMLTLGLAGALAAQGTAEDYRRAAQFLPWNVRELALNVRVEPHWLTGSERFWYRREVPGGHEFVLVDAARAERRPAFDHARLARALGAAADREISADRLPFARLVDLTTDQVRFDAFGSRWTCELNTYACREAGPGVEPRADELVSPDGRWTAYVRGHDLYVRNRITGAETRLTADGEPFHDYGRRPEARQNPIRDRLEGVLRPPAAVWSPDSRRLVTHRLDQR